MYIYRRVLPNMSIVVPTNTAQSVFSTQQHSQQRYIWAEVIGMFRVPIFLITLLSDDSNWVSADWKPATLYQNGFRSAERGQHKNSGISRRPSFGEYLSKLDRDYLDPMSREELSGSSLRRFSPPNSSTTTRGRPVYTMVLPTAKRS